MSLFGSSNPSAGGAAGFPRSVSFGGQENKPTFSFGNTQPAPGAGAKPSLFGTQNNAQQGSSGGLFGQNNTQGSSGSLFGQNNAQTSQSGGLFGTQSNNQSGQSGGLFGTQNNAQQGQSGGLFGAQNNTQQGQSGGLFGQNNQQSGQSGGLFGQNNQQSGQSGGLFGGQNNQSGQSGGLFGQNSQSGQSGGLFGQNNQTGQSGGLFGQSNQQSGQSGGLFGGQNNQSGQSGGLFGSQNQSSQSGGLFGAKPSLFGQPSGTQPASGGLFGAKPSGGLFGASTQPAATGSALGAPPASGLLQHAYYQRERFNELPDASRTLLEEMDKVIQGQMQIKNELRARDQASEPRRLPTELHELASLQESIAAALESDVLRLQTLGARVERDRVDQLQLHNVAQHAKNKLSDGSSFVDWLRHFYERAADEDVARIHRYRVTMEQIERHLLSLDQREQFAPRVIAEIIYDQNASFMGLAEQIATLHAEIDTLKKDYVKWYQARFQSVRDPFAPGVSVAEGA